MNKLNYSALLLICISLFFTSCSKDDDQGQEPVPTGQYANGILISNEGPFGSGSGTISFISYDFNTVEHNIYQNVNGSGIGNVVNAMGFSDTDAYIVANNSNLIRIANRYTFESKGSITSGLENPRHFVTANNDFGYVSNWGDPTDEEDDFIAVIDLNSQSVMATIPVTFGPERMVAHNNRVYVAHQGGYGHNHVISVIAGNELSNTITVGDAPQSMAIVGNNLFVLGTGKPSYTGDETAGTLTKIDLTTETVVERVDFEMSEHPENLTTDGTHLFYNLNGQVYKLAANSISDTPTPLFDGFFYQMQVRDNLLYATDAVDFASQGRLYVYDLTTNQKIEDLQVGIIPGGIYFNE